jgi:hypothetical protein
MHEHTSVRLLNGTVKTATGREASHAEVTLWWQRIRDRVRLADGRTSENGRYELHYTVPESAPRKVLLVVEANGGGLEQPLFSQQRESFRVSRRLHFLRGWSNGQYVEEISG